MSRQCFSVFLFCTFWVNLLFGQLTQVGNAFYGDSTFRGIGRTVAIAKNGTRLAFNSSYYLDSVSVGSIRIFDYKNGVWSQVGQTIPGSIDFKIGYNVALSADGEVVAFGSPSADTLRGVVKVYTFQGSKWVQLGSNIIGPRKRSMIGYDVDISGNGKILAVAGKYDKWDNGIVQVFGLGVSSISKIGNDIFGLANQECGRRVKTNYDGSRVVISCENRARVYQFDSSSNWSQIGADFVDNQNIGLTGHDISISDSGNIVAISAPNSFFRKGLVRVYRTSSQGWQKIGSDIIGNISDYLGTQIALSGNGKRLLVGSVGNGKARVEMYHLIAGTWTSFGLPTYVNPPRKSYDNAIDLSVSGEMAAIGLPYDSTQFPASGKVAIFKSWPLAREILSNAFNFSQLCIYNNQLYGEFDSNISGVGELAIYDSSGAKIFQSHEQITTGTNRIEIPFPQSARGIYIVSMDIMGGYKILGKVPCL